MDSEQKIIALWLIAFVCIVVGALVLIQGEKDNETQCFIDHGVFVSGPFHDDCFSWENRQLLWRKAP
jgi:hypothetical protein